MKKIIAIPGSIREKSYNKSVCRFLEKLSNGKVSIEMIELDGIPLFNEDLETDIPENIEVFIKKIDQADGFIISTPEYNNMIPGVLKNALDWLSRSYAKSAVVGKKVAITGVSTGGFGTVRAQNQLLLLMNIMGMRTDASLRMPISRAREKFDENGSIVDENLKEKLTELKNSLINIL